MKKQAFTLVELIVVITILAILATVGFVSFSGYLAGARDTNRIAQLKSMSDALELYRTKKDLPIPDDKVDVQANGTTIAYQGNIGANVLETIEYTEKGLDPKDKNYFSYYLTKNKKHFQLLSFLEEASEDTLAGNNIFNTSQAVDYSERVPHVKGKKLGILTDENNTPIQDISGVTSDGYLDISDVGTTVYNSIISDEEITSGSGTELSSLHSNGSCKRIRQVNGGSSDGLYTIDPEGNGVGFEVYCDMTTDGGGWTLVVSQYGDTYTKITSMDISIVEKRKAGSHSNIDKIFSSSTEFRWTDINLNRFLQGKTDMDIWWDKLNNQACNTTGNTIDVFFEGGWFDTGSSPRLVESCITYPFGMRNNRSYAPFTDIEGYNDSSSHMCWYDEGALDRPFINHGLDRSLCNQFDYNFETDAKRGGTMDYYIWLR